MQKATIINFEAAKGKYLEEKTGRHNGYRIETPGKKQPINPVDANSPANSNVFNEGGQKPQPEKPDGIFPPESYKGETQPPTEISNTIIDFQTARENRLVNQHEDATVKG